MNINLTEALNRINELSEKDKKLVLHEYSNLLMDSLSGESNGNSLEEIKQRLRPDLLDWVMRLSIDTLSDAFNTEGYRTDFEVLSYPSNSSDDKYHIRMMDYFSSLEPTPRANWKSCHIKPKGFGNK